MEGGAGESSGRRAPAPYPEERGANLPLRLGLIGRGLLVLPKESTRKALIPWVENRGQASCSPGSGNRARHQGRGALKETPTMMDNRHTLRPHIADMMAVERHILEAIRRQAKDDDLRRLPDIDQILHKIAAALTGHVGELEIHLEGFRNGKATDNLKGIVGSALGTLAGIYDQLRKDTASRALRDDYTALSLAAMSYTMLHTTALGLGQDATAELALRHLKDLTPLLVEISKLMPAVVARELTFEGYPVESAVAPQAARNTHEAWSPEYLRGQAGPVPIAAPALLGR